MKNTLEITVEEYLSLTNIPIKLSDEHYYQCIGEPEKIVDNIESIRKGKSQATVFIMEYIGTPVRHNVSIFPEINVVIRQAKLVERHAENVKMYDDVLKSLLKEKGGTEITEVDDGEEQ